MQCASRGFGIHIQRQVTDIGYAFLLLGLCRTLSNALQHCSFTQALPRPVASEGYMGSLTSPRRYSEPFISH